MLINLKMAHGSGFEPEYPLKDGGVTIRWNTNSPHPCIEIKMVASTGLEPIRKPSEGFMLPLHYEAINFGSVAWIRTKTLS